MTTPARTPPPRMTAAEYREFVGVATPAPAQAPAAPEPRARPTYVEQETVHKPFAAYLGEALPLGAGGCWWTHFPGGGWRSKSEAPILKAMGTLPGVSDFLLVKYGFLFALEAKAPGGTLNDNQIAFRRHCLRTGTPYELMFEPQEGEDILRRWGFPLKLTWREFEGRALVGQAVRR